MRQIKFRAWDKKNKSMVEIDGEDLFIANGEIYEVYETGHHNYNPYMRKAEVTDLYELMQYTGIKDRSSKEIYEGDMVIIRNKEEQYVIQENGFMDTAFVPGWEMKGEVKFLYHCWFIEGPDGKGCPIDFGGEEGLEVIGNIYEHTHLLEVDSNG